MYIKTPLKIAALILAASAVSAGCSTANARLQPPLPAVECSTKLTRSGPVIDIESTITARMASTGVYELMIRKSGRSGSVKINQGGDFDLRQGESMIAGATTLNGKVADIKVSFTLTTNGRTIECARN